MPLLRTAPPLRDARDVLQSGPAQPQAVVVACHANALSADGVARCVASGAGGRAAPPQQQQFPSSASAPTALPRRPTAKDWFGLTSGTSTTTTTASAPSFGATAAAIRATARAPSTHSAKGAGRLEFCAAVACGVKDKELSPELPELLCCVPLMPPLRPYPPALSQLARGPDGVVDEVAEIVRCKALLAFANKQPVGVGSKRRVPDLRFSWEPVPPLPPELAAADKRLAVLRRDSERKPLTPFLRSVWAPLLADHEERLDVALWLDTMAHGANLAFSGPRNAPVVHNNYPLTREQFLAVDREIKADVAAGFTVGPFDELPFSNGESSPIGVVEKRENGVVVGDRRINDLSANGLASINSYTDRIKQRTSTWDLAMAAIATLALIGVVWMSKDDVDKAFRRVPVRPEDQHICFASFGLASGTSMSSSFSAAALARPYGTALEISCARCCSSVGSPPSYTWTTFCACSCPRSRAQNRPPRRRLVRPRPLPTRQVRGRPKLPPSWPRSWYPRVRPLNTGSTRTAPSC